MSDAPVDDFLAELLASAQVNSSGNFSMDTGRTLDKLSRFQLPKAQSYVRNLASSAIASGARLVKVYCDADDTIFEFDGRAYRAELLSELFQSLFQPQSNAELRPTRELAIGLLGVRALAPSRVTLVSWDKGVGLRLELRDNAMKLRRLDSAPWKPSAFPITSRIHVRERLGLRTLDKWLANTTACTPEELELRISCSLSPVPIEVNGKRLQPSLPRFKKAYLLRSSHHPKPWFDTEKWHDAMDSPLCSGIVGPTYGPHPLDIVVEGVSFPLSDPVLERMSIGGVVYASHLQKSLSQTSLVHNQDHQLLVDWLRNAAQQWVGRS